MTDHELLIIREMATASTKLDALSGTAAEIKTLLQEMGGRLRTAEKSITRLNLVVFGICAPAALVALGAVIQMLLV